MEQEIYMIRVTLVHKDEQSWIGFVHQDGEPVEWDELVDAQAALAKFMSGVEQYDTMNMATWRHDPQEVPTVVDGHVYRAMLL